MQSILEFPSRALSIPNAGSWVFLIHLFTKGGLFKKKKKNYSYIDVNFLNPCPQGGRELIARLT